MIKKILAVLLVVLILGAGVIAAIMYMPSSEAVDPLTYFNEFKEGQENMVIEDQRVSFEKPIIVQDGTLYVSQEVAREYIDKTIFYDANEGIMTITTPQELIRLYRNGTTIKVNGKESHIKAPIIEVDGRGYLPESFLEERYDFEIQTGKDARLHLASTTNVQKQTAQVKTKKAELRTHPDRKALITEQVKRDTMLTVYRVENGYARVRSENGIIGYIPERDIKIIGVTEVTKRYESAQLAPVANPLDGKVKLVWDQMTVRTAGDWNSKKYTKIKGANVISPTWFELEDEEGNLIDRGSKAYVESAHARGLQVWPLMSHNFIETHLTRKVLTSTNSRQNVINQLLEAADQYGFDGINIDIENVQEDFGEEWVQFMRELTPQMKQKGLTVTVDIYMPSAWSGHYQRQEVAEVVDYFIVMAYDQHWGGSKVAGPVAGLDWVEEGLVLNLQEVPKHKLVLGIPFFTRIWEENEEGMSSRALGIEGARSTVKQWGVPVTIDEKTGLSYAEVNKNNKHYRVWLEDETSIQKRVALIEQYELAGYGGWKLGLESDGVWDILNTVK